MKINFTPQRSDDRLILHRAGDTLTFNGVSFDFSRLPEGGEVPAESIGCPWIVGYVKRERGELCLSLIVPHGKHAPQETLQPAPMTVWGDGPVDLPPYDTGAADVARSA